MNVGTRDAHNRPYVARAVGCRVSPDRRRVTVFLPLAHAADVVRCLRETGTISVAFTRTTTHESLQLKGSGVAVSDTAKEDDEHIPHYRREFTRELLELGHTAEFAQALLGDPAEPLAAVSFAPSSAFLQTPGPRAGQRLEAPR